MSVSKKVSFNDEVIVHKYDRNNITIQERTVINDKKNKSLSTAKNPKAHKALLITGITLVILGFIAVTVGLSIYYAVVGHHFLSQIITVKEGLYLIAAPAAGVVVLTTSAILIIKYLIKQSNLKKKEQLNQTSKRKESCIPSWISKERFYR